MRIPSITLVLCLLADVAGAAPPAAIYPADPEHLWNPLHDAMLVRDGVEPGERIGVDSVDPILWANTKHLLSGESHRRAIATLDEFLAARGHKLIDDPLKRAILQRDLWAVFDWSCGDGRRERTFTAERAALQARLAKAIGRLALTREQIAALPDTYAAAVASGRFAAAPDEDDPHAPFLPPDLLDPAGPWLNLFRPGEGIAASLHVRSFGGRSTFEALLRHPAGREAGIKYLQRLSEFPEPYVSVRDDSDRAGRHQLVLNPALPQLPRGTQVALLRRAMLIDTAGELAPTKLLETVQLRVYLDVPEKPADAKTEDQSFHEFNFTRRGLFADPARALHAVGADEQDFLHVQFASHGIDSIEAIIPPGGTRRLKYPVLASCFPCHSGAGIFSVNTFNHHFGPQTHRPQVGESDSQYQFDVIATFKRQRFDYGLLQGLIRAGNQGEE